MQRLPGSLALGLLAIGTTACPAGAQTLRDLYPPLATIVPSDGTLNDQFGHRVSLDGDTLAVGVQTDDVGTNTDQGSVRIYVRSGAAWTLQQTLTASDGAAGDYFGYSVSLSGDTLAVGAYGDDVGTNANQGSVRIYVRSGATWTLQQTLTASDGAAGDYFGHSVSLSGETLAVGADWDDVGSNVDQGSVRVYARTGAGWNLQATFTASDGAASDLFGAAVSLDGDTLAASATNDDVGPNANQGSVRIYARIGITWSLQATITASDGSAYDYFGSSVSLDGNTLAVGSPYDDVGTAAAQGAVRVFVRTGTAWNPQATITAGDGAPYKMFGASVSLEGNTLAVGVPGDDIGSATDRGSVQAFVRTGAVWNAQATITAIDGAIYDNFGNSVSLSGDTLAVGVPNDTILNVNPGSVRIFGNYRVFNSTRNTGYGSLASAVNAGFAGDRLLAGAVAFDEADGIVDSSTTRFTITALAPLTLPSTALLSVAPGTVFERSLDVASAGLAVAGKLVAPVDGTVTFEQCTVSAGGQLLQRGATLLVNQSMATSSGGVCYLQGQVLAEAVTTAAGGQNRVSGNTDVFANYVNAGSTVIQRGILYIYGSLTNTGTITGQYSTGILPPNPGDGFSIGGDYVVSAGSSILLPDPVWWLRVGGNFDVAIDDAARFVMAAATLELTGTGPAAQQSVEVLSADLGAVDDAFDPDNFPLGSLRVRSGATVRLVDAHDNAPGTAGEATYVQGLYVPAGATLVTNGHRVYVREATIGGTVSNPADIIVVPGTPPCAADLYQDGIVNGADLAALLSAWGTCPPGTCRADLTGDGQVNGADLASLLSQWGPCP